MEWNVSARIFQPLGKKGDESEIMKLYPKGGVTVINRNKLSNKGAEIIREDEETGERGRPRQIGGKREPTKGQRGGDNK